MTLDYTFYLACTPPTRRKPRAIQVDTALALAPCDDVARCRALWHGVGAGFWREREDWTHERWCQRLAEPGVSYFAATRNEQDIGGLELWRSGDVAGIEGFGLLPLYRGRGLGRTLLARACERAFADGATVIRLATATDDHPAALPNYLSSGFRIERVEPLTTPMPRDERLA